MKVFLMYKDRDFDPEVKLPTNEKSLTQDLELNTLFNAMALGDSFLFDAARKVVLSSLNDPKTILYRQNILKDCIKNSAVIRSIYDITIETIEIRRKNYLGGMFSNHPSSVLYGSAQLMQLFEKMLKKIKNIADEHAYNFESEGFKVFFGMIKKEFDDEYFTSIHNHLKELKFRNGVLISAELISGNVGSNYMLRKALDKDGNWMKWVLRKRSPVYTFFIDPRDESGANALSELNDRGVNLVANALAQSTEHIFSFFNVLRLELAFYISCLNLYEQLNQIEEPISFPLPVLSNKRGNSFKGLYDICLALTKKQKVIGNNVDLGDKDLVIITGANQGGKSTFLRSIGLAQLMMQCGMFVPAEFFCASICERLFTHYRRKEDVTMKSGKLDEELSRMSDILDNLAANSLVLFNESFAATNEREGSEIARQIVSALIEEGIKVFYVTHMYEFAHGLYDKKSENAIFLRAQRQIDETRTFKIVKGEPLQTSYGMDLYNKIFGKEKSNYLI
ncbi:MAG: MutS-related protein [Candidatus Humimicrobiaceae bacterium]